MGKKWKCFCGRPACAYRLDGEVKTYLCIEHIPTDEVALWLDPWVVDQLETGAKNNDK
jgi:hypothetical protein